VKTLRIVKHSPYCRETALLATVKLIKVRQVLFVDGCLVGSACSLVNTDQCFRGAYRLQQQGNVFKPKRMKWVVHVAHRQTGSAYNILSGNLKTETT
jgi:hypothetical protein